MNSLKSIPTVFQIEDQKITLIEAHPGEIRRNYIVKCLTEARQNGSMTWFLPCDQSEGGPWAGLNNLFEDLVPQILIHAPDLINKHDYELVHILPTLRQTINVRYLSLTDVVAEDEQTRSHPADRASRIVHGLINLFISWCQRLPNSSYIVACDNFDTASILVRTFFVELFRRNDHQIHLTLLLSTSSEAMEAIKSQFNHKYFGCSIKLYHFDQVRSSIPKEMSQLALNLEHQIGDDPFKLEESLPKLIHYWLISEHPQKAVVYQIRACIIYAKRGFYENALVYGKAVIEHVEHHSLVDPECFYQLVETIYTCHVALHHYDDALYLLENAIKSTNNPDFLYSYYYMLAVLHARYFSSRDYSKAEEYLEEGLKQINCSNLSEELKLLRLVSYYRGISLIRFREGKSFEAIDIAKFCYEEIRLKLGLNSHALKQSVLSSIIAQVYTSIGSYAEAINHFTLAISMDPNYSEYYNHRGKVYFKMGNLDEAINDYLKAIELSPPYSEVWTNLGQCYREKNCFAEAVYAYSIALDLNPFQSLALVGRAQAFEMLEQPEKALIDYSEALTLNPNQPLLLANRAILYYDSGQYQVSLSDLNEAINLSPENSALYQNRAIVLTALEHVQESIQDQALHNNMTN